MGVYWLHSSVCTSDGPVARPSRMSCPICNTYSFGWRDVSRIMTFDVNLYIQDHLTMTLQWSCVIMSHIAVSALQRIQFWMDSCHICHKWSLAWEGVSFRMNFGLDLYRQGHSTKIFLNKMLKYGTFCRVCSTACVVQGGLFPYLAQMIISIRECRQVKGYTDRSIFLQ